MTMQVYFLLALAILAETAGTTALQASQQFTRFWPSVIVVLAYAISFYLLALTLRYMPVGVVYAIWSGLGIVFIAAMGYVIFGQTLDLLHRGPSHRAPSHRAPSHYARVRVRPCAREARLSA